MPPDDVENVVKDSISGQQNTYKQSQRYNLDQACCLLSYIKTAK